jgi:hypothetical protein
MARVDDPTGGARLTHRLMRWLPAAFFVGLVIGIVLAILSGEWRVAVTVSLGLPAIVGLLLAAVEDGRVNRRVKRDRGGP